SHGTRKTSPSHPPCSSSSGVCGGVAIKRGRRLLLGHVALRLRALNGNRPRAEHQEVIMVDNIYNITEIVGTSQDGTDPAISNAIQEASKTLHNLDWFEVQSIRGKLNEGHVVDWQVTIKIGFRHEAKGKPKVSKTHKTSSRRRWVLQCCTASRTYADVRSSMPRTTMAIGSLLTIMGMIAYIATAFASWTARIPAILGLTIVIYGLVALVRPKVGLILALVVSVLGMLGTSMNVMQLGELFAGSAERPAAAITSALTSILLIIYVIAGIRALTTVRGRSDIEPSNDEA